MFNLLADPLNIPKDDQKEVSKDSKKPLIFADTEGADSASTPRLTVRYIDFGSFYDVSTKKTQRIEDVDEESAKLLENSSHIFITKYKPEKTP